MHSSPYPWCLGKFLPSHLSLGGLVDLCEENYRLLLRLMPDNQMLRGRYLSALPRGMDLHLEILEQSRYTTLLHLTYYFHQEYGALPDPDATLRAYHDAGQVEVLDLRQSALPLNRGPLLPTLAQKWRINLFLSKWLTYCVAQGHRFQGARSESYPTRQNGMVTSL